MWSVCAACVCVAVGFTAVGCRWSVDDDYIASAATACDWDQLHQSSLWLSARRTSHWYTVLFTNWYNARRHVGDVNLPWLESEQMLVLILHHIQSTVDRISVGLFLQIGTGQTVPITGVGSMSPLILVRRYQHG